jgi:hypothetical protein
VTSGDDATFVETIAVASDAPQGSTISATVDFLLNGLSGGADFTQSISISVNDVTPPTVACDQTTNPAGKNVPGSNASPKAGQNPDGFYLLSATDNVDPSPLIYVVDSATGYVAGPFHVGDKVKITQAPGVTPTTQAGSGDIVAHILIQGDALIYAVDASGNVSAREACLVPPPPK